MENFIVRKATVDDAYGITFVNAHTRYSAYKGLIPDKVLQSRIDSIDERTRKTRKFLEDGKTFLVVENTQNHEIIGMLSYSASRNEKYPDSGEIVAIYLLPKYQKLGIGKKLFIAGIKELIKLGYNSMIINVLKGNDTINFYKKYNGKVVGEIQDSHGNVLLHEYVLFFENLKSIN